MKERNKENKGVRLGRKESRRCGPTSWRTPDEDTEQSAAHIQRVAKETVAEKGRSQGTCNDYRSTSRVGERSLGVELF